MTGVGGVTPLGTGVDVFWPRILKGESGIAPITLLDPTDFATHIAGEVTDFTAEDWVDRKDANRLDRFIIFGAAASTMALRDSGIPTEGDIAEEIGVLIGSGIGGMTLVSDQCRRLHAEGPSKVSPFLVPYMIPDMASGFTSIQHGLKGPNTCVVSACSTGADAIGVAYHTVKRGDAVAMVTGGCEAPINDIGLAGFCAARAMTTNNSDPLGASRPFDLNRDGFVMAEGGAIVIVEDMDHALARGAKIYGEIVGYGMTGDAFHITAPDPEGSGAIRAMKMALRNANMQPEEIQYINAHGTSTQLNDKSETRSIKAVFGDHAYKLAVSSTKSMIGHMLGAAGAIEAVFCLLAMRDGMLPPTVNYNTPDPECDLDYVPNLARKATIDATLSNSFGFGGHNVSLVFRKFKP